MSVSNDSPGYNNLEARLDAEVDAILDELLGVQAEPPT
ncbi:DUF826 domain-containing protein, partial [Escherichia coli]